MGRINVAVYFGVLSVGGRGVGVIEGRRVVSAYMCKRCE